MESGPHENRWKTQEPHTDSDSEMERGAQKKLRTPRLPTEGSTFAMSRCNLMPKDWSVMTKKKKKKNVAQHARQKENCQANTHGYKQYFFISHLGPEACDSAPIFHWWLLVSDNKTVPLK